MMQTTTERRTATSCRVAYGLPIALSHEGYNEPFEAECVDLSPGGLSLRASCLPGIGELLTCHFTQPDTGESLDVRGEVVWAHLEGHRGGEFGVRFQDADAAVVTRIRGVIRQQHPSVRPEPVAAAKVQPDTARRALDGAADTARLAVDGTADSFTARLLRRSAGLVTFEQELSFLRLGRGVSAYQGDDVQRGAIASVAVRMDDGTPKLMVTLRYADSELPDDAHTRDEAAVAADTVQSAQPQEPPRHDTVPDLTAPATEPVKMQPVTLVEFDASRHSVSSGDNAPDEELPRLSTRSEFDLPAALDESLAPSANTFDATQAADDEEDQGPALFTTAGDDNVAPALRLREHDVYDDTAFDDTAREENGDIEADNALDAHDELDAEQYETAAARLLGDRPASVPDAVISAETTTTATPTHAETATTPTTRPDVSVMFTMEGLDDTFRPQRDPSTLTLALRLCLSLWHSAVTWLTPRVAQARDALASGVLRQIRPWSQQGLLRAQQTWTSARSNAGPTALRLSRAATNTLRTLQSKLGSRTRKRRTTAIPQVSVQPSTTRRMVAVEAPRTHTLRWTVLGAIGATGLALAAYALWAAPSTQGVPVHREVVAPLTPAQAAVPTDTATTPSVAPATATTTTGAPPRSGGPAIELPPVPTALPAPSFEAGRIGAPSYPSIDRAPAPALGPAAAANVAVASATAAPTNPATAVAPSTQPAPAAPIVTANAGSSSLRFGAATVRGQRFSLRMSAPVKSVSGVSDAGGFTVTLEGALSLDRAGPIAASHNSVARSMILNKGDRSELTIRFVDGRSPAYQVYARGDVLDITIE